MSDLEHNHYEMVPGTVHLVDMLGDLKVQKGEGNIILIPQPSANINDPLRWSTRKRYFQFALVFVWSFLLAAGCNLSGPIFAEWTVVFNCSFFDLTSTVAIACFFLGIGCVVLQPTALKLGRRFVYLLCTIIMMVSQAIRSRATNLGYLYGSAVLAGFSAAPVDSLVEISTTDIFFQHERSTAMGLVIFALCAGNNLAPVATGYIATSMGWRWVFYMMIIILAVTFVVQLFLMEDTSFRRSSDITVLEAEILTQIKSRETIDAKGGRTDIKTEEVSDIDMHSDEKTHGEDDESSIPLRSYAQRMAIIHREYNDTRPWIKIFFRPFLLVRFPAFIWGGFIYGVTVMWITLLASTTSEIYGLPPYNFTPNQVGLTNLGAAIGSFVGMFFGGPFVDYVVIQLSKRNNGIFEPEFRLYAHIIPTILNSAGILAYGLTSYSGAHWAISVVLGQGLIGFSMSAAGSISLSYPIDCYQKIASEGLVLILFIRNMIAMGFCFALQPWIDACGLKVTTWLLFLISMALNGTFILMILFGKRFRRWTADAYERYSDPTYTGF
ncbi:putative ion transporter [Scheffersomyces coipomensis]|uniref:putative ion transporter n=1 Tax=Scheffersomyces coipomensis TaxID=1788519 RepID=UPI00315D7B30